MPQFLWADTADENEKVPVNTCTKKWFSFKIPGVENKLFDVDFVIFLDLIE